MSGRRGPHSPDQPMPTTARRWRCAPAPPRPARAPATCRIAASGSPRSRGCRREADLQVGLELRVECCLG
eukprot:10052184-Alexandrium_andersonii.AAC.1